jgi:hypothetical protein
MTNLANDILEIINGGKVDRSWRLYEIKNMCEASLKEPEVKEESTSKKAKSAKAAK